jgi:hypothetical protein
MSKRAFAALVLATAAAATIAEGPPADPSLGQMASDMEPIYNQPGSNYQTYRAEQADTDAPPGTKEADKGIGRNPLSDSSTIGSAINTAASGARNAEDWWDASNLLDRTTDGRYEPDLTGQGAPEIPAALCGASMECNQCYARVFTSLDAMRLDLERLRITGQATADYVSKSYALGDGLSGVTGLAALQWQHERAGIAKTFDHFKGTYDTKYEAMMKGLKDVMDRWDACEAGYGERNWYARFGFLYYQFMRDKYKRNF